MEPTSSENCSTHFLSVSTGTWDIYLENLGTSANWASPGAAIFMPLLERAVRRMTSTDAAARSTSKKWLGDIKVWSDLLKAKKSNK